MTSMIICSVFLIDQQGEYNFQIQPGQSCLQTDITVLDALESYVDPSRIPNDPMRYGRCIEEQVNKIFNELCCEGPSLHSKITVSDAITSIECHCPAGILTP
jgi:hypothetical protein